MKRYKTVDEFMDNIGVWEAELKKLRKILLSTNLEEAVKWGQPTYTHTGKNVVAIGAFKSYFGLWFYQGALLEDKQGVLTNAQEGKTKALRQWRMTAPKDIKATTIKSYVKEAAALAAAGKTIKVDRSKPVTVPDELKTALASNKSAAAKFDKLTPGEQREFASYIANAKRDSTKLKRIEKILPMILDGVGLSDKYRNC